MSKIKKFFLVIFLLVSCPTSYAGGESPPDQNSQIRITEIFANPKGKDEGKEWIEIYNNGTETISLENWSIKTDKNFSLSNLQIEPKSFLIIDNKTLKLKNETAIVQLLNPNGKIIDQIQYGKSIEGKSFSKTKILKGETQEIYWEWLEPSKNSPNPTFHEIKGLLFSSPQINKEYFFEVISEKGKLEIVFEQESHDFEILRTILTKGTKISLLAQKINENTYLLKEYQITDISSQINPQTNSPTKDWEFLLLIPIAILLSALICINYNKQLSNK